MPQTLNLLEGFDLKAMGQNSADYVHTVTEAMKLGFADRDRYYGDPAQVRVPADALLSKSYAEARRALIDPQRASREIRPGDPAQLGLGAVAGGRRPGRSARPDLPADRSPLGTTCINVVDAEGNLWSATPSGAWLPSVIAGDTGIPLSQRMQAFSLVEGHPNRLARGSCHATPSRPRSPRARARSPRWPSAPRGSMSRPDPAAALPGISEFGLGLQEAGVPALRFPAPGGDLRSAPRASRRAARGGRVSGDVIEDLKRRGHIIEVIGDWRHASAPTIVAIDRATGVRSAAADPRRDRYAFAW